MDARFSLLAQASLPLKFWDEAFSIACFLINRLPSEVIAQCTPIEKLFGSKPNYSLLKTYGCACCPNLRPYNAHKLQFQSKQCVFIGYSNFHKGYKCLHKPTRHVYISRDVIFDEYVFPFAHDTIPQTHSFHRNDALLPLNLFFLPHYNSCYCSSLYK